MKHSYSREPNVVLLIPTHPPTDSYAERSARSTPKANARYEFDLLRTHCHCRHVFSQSQLAPNHSHSFTHHITTHYNKYVGMCLPFSDELLRAMQWDWMGGGGWAEECMLLLELFQVTQHDAARVGMSKVSFFFFAC